ncbi:MAG: hypothetical protein NTX50_17670 [Candidatus Sumerlaeota bacterium]|nr:hypothetical protein [Candidatus Sumerlaeota bacterium]
MKKYLFLGFALIFFAPYSRAEMENDPLAAWRGNVTVKPVSIQPGRHTIHSYFNVSPESPDGRWVVFYASTEADAGHGEVHILERATGREQAIARNVTVEDAHRSACQQWISRGRTVVFHDERNGEWTVAAMDIGTLQERVLARGRQVGWGQSNADVIPLYSPHSNPGACRDMELLDVTSGAARVAVRADAVREAYPEWTTKAFADKPISIFFPVLSPDLKKVFFKLATPAGGDVRSKEASDRQGLICYDLEHSRFLFLREKWGRPAWSPDGRSITEVGNLFINSDNGSVRREPGLPNWRSSHPSSSPDGRLLVTDTTMDPLGGKASDWAIVVEDARESAYTVVHTFDNSRGARSWRRSHPHPVFSADGRRIYFNVSSSEWTQLWVAEIGGKPSVP